MASTAGHPADTVPGTESRQGRWGGTNESSPSGPGEHSTALGPTPVLGLAGMQWSREEGDREGRSSLGATNFKCLHKREEEESSGQLGSQEFTFISPAPLPWHLPVLCWGPELSHVKACGQEVCTPAGTTCKVSLLGLRKEAVASFSGHLKDAQGAGGLRGCSGGRVLGD